MLNCGICSARTEINHHDFGCSYKLILELQFYRCNKSGYSQPEQMYGPVCGLGCEYRNSVLLDPLLEKWLFE
jgi:hypothetical protein